MKKGQQLDWLVFGGYFLAVMVLGISKGKLIFPNGWLEILVLWLGGLVGWLMVWLDCLVYIYWLHPETQVSQYIRYHFDRKNFKVGWRLLEQRQGEMEELTLRSALFQIAWVILALFALTSTASIFGKALVMGLGGRILLEEWQGYLSDKQTLKRLLFWQIKRQISNQELQWYLYVITGLFAGLSLLLI